MFRAVFSPVCEAKAAIGSATGQGQSEEAVSARRALIAPKGTTQPNFPSPLVSGKKIDLRKLIIGRTWSLKIGSACAAVDTS